MCGKCGITYYFETENTEDPIKFQADNEVEALKFIKNKNAIVLYDQTFFILWEKDDPDYMW